MALSAVPHGAAAGTLTALHAPDFTAWVIRGDREMYCSWLSVRPAPPGRGGYVRGFWLEQAHADQPPVVIDALDRVAVQLELGDDGGWEVNPAGLQRPAGRRPRAVAPAAVVAGRQRASSTDWSPPADCGRLERFPSDAAATGRLATDGLAAAHRCSRRSRLTRCPILATDVATLPTPPPRARARIQRVVGDQRE